jgi:hypothetical protein
VVTDAAVLAEIRREWDGVVTMRDRMRTLCAATFAFGAFTAPALGDILYTFR